MEWFFQQLLATFFLFCDCAFLCLSLQALKPKGEFGPVLSTGACTPCSLCLSHLPPQYLNRKESITAVTEQLQPVLWWQTEELPKRWLSAVTGWHQGCKWPWWRKLNAEKAHPVHLQKESTLFSFECRIMVPQKTRTGLIQILALIRLRMTHWGEFFQTWWAEQIKLLLTCLVCRSDYGLLSHLSVAIDYSSTSPAHWAGFHYEDFLNIASQLSS